MGACAVLDLCSIFLPFSLILFSNSGLWDRQTQSASRPVGQSANCIIHRLSVDTVLGALGIAGSKQIAPCPSGSYILLGRQRASQRWTKKYKNTVLNCLSREDRDQNTGQIWDAGTVPSEHHEGLSGFSPLGTGYPPSTPHPHPRKHTHTPLV